MNETVADPLAEYRRVNVEGTLHLARAAVQAGVRRFVFVSSIKVNGETSGSSPFRADQRPTPSDPYGVSKLEAEQGLLALRASDGLEVAIVRPPVVYGPGVKANFRSMMRLLHRGLPLPLGSADARRSLVAVENLADLLVRCAVHPAADGQTFLVSDGEDLSVSELLRRLGTALDRPARQLRIPPALIKLAARLLGRREFAQRLLMPLQVDIEPTRRALGWDPPFRSEDCLRRTATHFVQTR
jgi:nucleoside-diphosphate-sugar epimerase